MNIDGYDVYIDGEDEELLRKYKYRLSKSILKQSGRYYFIRSERINGKSANFMLHRDIMHCVKGDGKIVDHISGDTLDCRKKNLRICTISDNAKNRKINKNNISGYKGVSFRKEINMWISVIRVNTKQIYLGLFNDPLDAYYAYCKASKKYHGEYGRTE